MEPFSDYASAKMRQRVRVFWPLQKSEYFTVRLFRLTHSPSPTFVGVTALVSSQSLLVLACMKLKLKKANTKKQLSNSCWNEGCLVAKNEAFWFHDLIQYHQPGGQKNLKY